MRLYIMAGRCWVDIGPDTVVRLADSCRNIVSIKEASGSVERVGELRRRLPKEFTIMSGDDSLTLPFMAVGAVCGLDVLADFFFRGNFGVLGPVGFGRFKYVGRLQRKNVFLFLGFCIKI